MTRWRWATIPALLVAALVVPTSSGGAIGCDPAAPATCSLRELGARAGIRIGAAVDPGQLGDGLLTTTLAREFSSLTAENAMKWYAVEPTRGNEDYAGADALVAFAEAHGMEVRGHNLLWAQDAYTPAWVKAITDPDDLRAVVEHHISSEVGRYAGRVPRWDVVNEPLASVGTGTSGSVFERVLGPGWLADAYRTAHQADPGAELWLNEYGTDWVPGKHAALLALVRQLLRDGAPLDGIGLQTHRLGVDGPDRATFERQLRDFADLGLKVAITELDVAIRPGDPTGLARQAEAYRTIVESCLAVTSCVEVTTWGISDRDTWLDGQGILPAPTRPLLFDDDFAPKPAREAVAAALAAGRVGATTTTTMGGGAGAASTTSTAVPSGSGAPPASPVPADPAYTG
ncbi:MAG: endo-1,4-beta-xylanase [Acidimicrobiales bacterium]